VWIRESNPDYKSSWISIGTNAVYSVNHGLGQTPSRVLYQFSSDYGSTIVYEGWGWYFNDGCGWHFVKTDSPYDYYNATTISVMTGSCLWAGSDNKPWASSIRFMAWK
jgi:hypothetical protein